MTTAPGGGAPPPRRTDARLNRDRLVAAAREVFAASGPGASLNEIARRAGVGPGTLYRHFPNRQVLLAAVLTDRVEALCARAGELLAEESLSADEVLARWAEAFLAHARDQQGVGSALLTDASYDLGVDCHRVIVDAAASVLAHAQEHGTARCDLAAADLVQLVTGVALATVHAGDAGQAGRLLSLTLDAVHAAPRKGRALA
ncbi:TetR family transcriptional regulator [Streptomyces spiroverticillatus]|uniref:TetR family transcriptional regulator n=1 Tax=Streptomyces finlayi TaxID=67296 RepID=A0A918X2G0_9ACTN|nr:TetR/AcrR family transcriptional regulator [Streptomyces finlayi]GHA22411.1 TetR family transcriptional regulator [Streptomyces spiroverticillatus]GHD04384.1 TetR family transcriptional regulator [Streptomyces finlayi]